MNNGRNITASGNAQIDGLLTGLAWQNNAITYSFPTASNQYGTAGSYGDNAPWNNFATLTVAAQNATRTILGEFAQVANVTFQEVTESTTVHGDMRHAYSSEPAVPPGTANSAYAYGPALDRGGDIFYDNASGGFYNNPVRGDESFLTLIHEIGHAMGLAHGHTADGAFPALPANADGNEFSVMTYRTFIGSDPNAPNSANGSWAQSLMMLDIQALQYMYGANYNSNAGNTTYTFDAQGQFFINGVNQGAIVNGTVFRTIWDGNGTDTYDFSNFANGVTIDLQPGNWSTLSQNLIAQLQNGGGQPARGNVANALMNNNDTRSLIENATGGAGNDTLIGNQVANLLNGGAGTDMMTGGVGNDTYIVDNAGDQTIEVAGQGDDTIMTSVNFDMPTSIERLTMTGNGDLRSNGNELANFMTGNSGNNYINGAGGTDVMTGGAGNDTYTIDNLNDVIVEQMGGGDDAVYSFNNAALSGNLETLILAPTAQNALQGFGDANVNQIFGNEFDNVIYGRGNVDRLGGGAGNDIFVMAMGDQAANQQEQITDFEGAGVAGGDRMGLGGFGPGATVVQVGTSSYEVRDANNVAQASFILEGVTTALIADDYYFN